MGEGSLSQDEIDALLQGADETSYDSGPIGGVSGGDELSPIDKDLLYIQILLSKGPWNTKP